jgi:MerR family mercuric resistance operon transcriptional regulator
MTQTVQIGKVAREAGLSVDSIRFYEKEGLLQEPARSDGGFRLYTAADIEHLRFIRSAQKLGFSLAEIRELLLIKDERTELCTHVRDLIKSRLGAIRGKIEDLRLLEWHLKQALHKCDDALGHGDAARARALPGTRRNRRYQNWKGNR